MILDFGYVCMEMHVILGDTLRAGDIYQAKSSALQIGGHAGLQAISAARAGARVSLTTIIGNDLFGEKLTDVFRREGLITTGTIKTEQATPVSQYIKDASGKITALNANYEQLHLNSAQIATTAMSTRHVVLLHDDVPTDLNHDIIDRAKDAGTMCVMSFYQQPDIQILSSLDYALIREPYAQIESDTCNIIPVKSDGFDCFCGSYTACLQAGLTRAQSMDYALMAQDLYIKSEKSGYDALPYLGNVEESINRKTT